MTFRKNACITAQCDDCGDAWGDTTPHYPSAAAAIADLANAGWTYTRGWLRCNPCARTAYCAVYGHQWTEWEQRTTPEGWSYQWRGCGHCQEYETSLDVEIQAALGAFTAITRTAAHQGGTT